MRPGAAAPDRARCRPAATNEQRHCGFGRRRTPPRRLQGPPHVYRYAGALLAWEACAAVRHAVSACGPHPDRQLPSGVGGGGAGLPPDQAEGLSHRRLQPPRSAPVPDGRRDGDRAARRHPQRPLRRVGLARSRGVADTHPATRDPGQNQRPATPSDSFRPARPGHLSKAGPGLDICQDRDFKIFF